MKIVDVNLLQRHFARIGARTQVRWLNRLRNRAQWPSTSREIHRVNCSISRFFVAIRPIWKSCTPDPRQRHLLLMSRTDADEKHKFLCGHDERHWFVAAVPEERGVSTVQTAMEALKPREVIGRQRLLQVRSKNWNRRKNEAFIRQGNGSSFQPLD